MSGEDFYDRGNSAQIMQSNSRTVADVMTRNVVTVSPSYTLTEIVISMAKTNSRHYLVVGAARRLLGMISEENILCALTREGNWETSHADELMSQDVIPLTPNAELSFAAAVMQSEGLTCLPVVDDHGRVCGILTTSDLLKNGRAAQAHLE
jgi:homoserine O-acetyltransferase